MATRVMRRPVIWGGAAVLVIVVLASPFLHVAFTGADASALPSSSSAGAAYALVQTRFPTFSEAPAGVLVDSSQVTPAELATYSTSVAHVAGVKAVPAFQHLGGSLWESSVVLTAAPLSPTAQRAVESSRPFPVPGHVTVIGQTASFLSLQHSLKSHLPVVLGLIVLIALVMLFAMTRSVTLPLMAVVMNFFTILATYGVLVWGFQRGHLSHLLGFHAPGALQSTSLIIILAVVFGLSTDYGVFLFGRIKEEHDAGATPDEAVALGMAHTGGIVTAAACCLALAMGALVLSRLVFVKEIGFGVAFAVILDATLVRAVLVPAVMKLLGSAAWWNPFSGALRCAACYSARTFPAVRAGGGPQCGSRGGAVMTTFRPFFNPATGEWIEYTTVAEDSNGELVRFTWRSMPGGVISEHVHPHQEERFTIVSGEAAFTLDGKPITATAGETIVVPPGVPHSEGNLGTVEITGVVELRPALHTKEFHEALAGLVADGRTTARGAPKNPCSSVPPSGTSATRAG
jgi:uncharacterized membrane protein YdfJ with MMPL/SSD domain/quercetin dioxygenase-like cupin family protein